MPRGGLSADPDKAQRQRETLAAGRAIAAERRAQGLPTKRTEQEREHGTGRVATGKPRGTPSASPKPSPKPSSKPSSKPKPTRRTNAASTAKPQAEGREPGRLLRAYARILGY